MKKITGIALALAFVFTACNSNGDKSKETTVADTVVKNEPAQPIAEQLYTCPMHPEVTGQKDSTCSKCGMKLTVPVKK